MSYITLSNLRRIIRDSNIEIDPSEEIYKIGIKYFSPDEHRALMAMKILIQDPRRFIEMYGKLNKYNNTKIIASEVAPAYHSKKTCPRLNSDFYGYLVPQQISSQGEEVVQQFKEWFRTIKHLESKPDLIQERVRLKWGQNINLEKITYVNSGNISFINESPENIEKQIEGLLLKASQLINNDNNSKKVIEDYICSIQENSSPLSYIDLSNQEANSIIMNFTTSIKKPLAKLLISYYRAKNNPELNISDEILSQLGFVPCQTCHNGIYKFMTQTEYFQLIDDIENYNKEMENMAFEYLDDIIAIESDDNNSTIDENN